MNFDILTAVLLTGYHQSSNRHSARKDKAKFTKC